MNAQNHRLGEQPQNLADIRRILPELLHIELPAANTARAYWAQHALPVQHADLISWLAGWQGVFPPRLSRPRIVLFAGHYGYPVVLDRERDEANRRIEALIACSDPLCGQAVEVDADLRLFELNLSHPVLDFTQAPTMSESECANVMVYGMTAAEMGVGMMACSTLGAGSTLAASVLARAIGAEELAYAWSPDMPMFEVEEGLDSFDLLRRYGSREIAALIGAIIAARMGRMPVALNGPGALMAAALLYKADKRAVQHCLYVADQTEPEGIKSFCTECDIMYVAPSQAVQQGTALPGMIDALREISKLIIH